MSAGLMRLQYFLNPQRLLWVWGCIILVSVFFVLSASGALTLTPEFGGVLFINVEKDPKFLVGISGQFKYVIFENAKDRTIDFGTKKCIARERIDNKVESIISVVRSEGGLSDGMTPIDELLVRFYVAPHLNVQYAVDLTDYGVLFKFRTQETKK